MNKSIKKYYDRRSACQVLGTLMLDPQIIKSRSYHLTQKDFDVEPLHKIIFTCIHNLAYQGVNEITIGEIEGYLANTSPVDYKRVFERYEGVEWIEKVIDNATPSNFDYYYERVKKLSLLRSYMEQGIDIKHILNRDEIDPNLMKSQEESFDRKSIEEIIKEIDNRHLEAKRNFIIKDGSESRKAGDNAKELRGHMKETPSYGLTLESEYLNTIIRGALKGKFMLETRDTGMGKSRLAIKRLLNFTVPKIWCFKTNKFISNPCGGHSGLYIGTELDLLEEIEPMMWAFVSGVDEDRIRDNILTPEEDARVDEAIKILEDTKLFLEDEPNFDLTYLWHIVEEYKVKHNIYAVMLDYIELTNALVAEYTKQTRGMGVREDQVLLELSAGLKNIAKRFDVFINAFTQTTDEARRDLVRDQRAVKGARSLPNKADVGIVTFEPTRKELKKLEPVIQSQTGLLRNKYPNICYSIYKNRGGKYKNIKVWGYQNLGTMEYHDLFCTNDAYEQINIDKTKISVVKDEEATS